jgi:hypothetical protein
VITSSGDPSTLSLLLLLLLLLLLSFIVKEVHGSLVQEKKP